MGKKYASVQENKKISFFTIFTVLLFAMSTPCYSYEQPIVLNDGVGTSKSSQELGSKHVSSSTHKAKSNLDKSTFDVSPNIDPTPRMNFANFLGIKCGYIDKTRLIPLRFKRHLCDKFEKTFMNPQTNMLLEKDMILSGKSKTDSFDPEMMQNQIPMKHVDDHDHYSKKDEEFGPKNMLHGEKIHVLTHKFYKVKKRQHKKDGFMRSIRRLFIGG
ncbi:hypothetical protein CTI12_AA485670 [Artemisia annua]|uniref:Uncharacterized protein n=1 Tax=Artemisia annua TaxID=35608 RepID=A0A2U1LJ51_ARTAN|nr:hypothetical protein CTI12_AA485670 [Artemisia annua]